MTARTRIKICGVSRPGDVEAAVEAGADAIGFVFHPPSARAVTARQAAELARALPPFVTPVVLFVNAAADAIAAVLDALPQATLQFHGDEAPADCGRWTRPWLRAARMARGVDLLDFGRRFEAASALVLDAPAEGWGGGGKTFDWSLVPRSIDHRIVLSGGLTAANVGHAIAAVRPYAVDVSSGVESAPGVKDPALIRRFCDAVRDADANRDAAGS